MLGRVWASCPLVQHQPPACHRLMPPPRCARLGTYWVQVKELEGVVLQAKAAYDDRHARLQVSRAGALCSLLRLLLSSSCALSSPSASSLSAAALLLGPGGSCGLLHLCC